MTSLVVIGSDKTIPLLGVTTLELLGFQVDPITGKLKPLELIMLYNSVNSQLNCNIQI